MVRMRLTALALIPLLALAYTGCQPLTLKQKIIEALVPAGPTDLVATPIGDDKAAAIRLSWVNHATDATAIWIERSSVSATGDFTKIAVVSASATTYDDTGLAGDTPYWYRVGAVNDVGPARSSVITATTFAIMTDVDAVAQDKAGVAIGYATGDFASSVTRDLSLPILGAVGGSTIAWASSEPTVINVTSTATTGKAAVVAPSDLDDTPVTLTATVSRGASSSTKPFYLNVKWTDSGSVAADKAAVAIVYTGGDSVSSVTGNLGLPTTGSHGTAISWQSSDSGTINVTATAGTGAVTRPSTMGDKTVTLIATIAKGSASDQLQFVVVVKLTDKGAANLDAAALVLSFGSGDSAASVTQDIGLALTGSHGTTITWTSSKIAAIEILPAQPDVAKVHRSPAGNVSVDLTATVARNGQTTVRVFAGLVVTQSSTNVQDIVDADSLSDYTIFASGDSSAAVTKDLVLPATGPNGSAIAWAQTSPASPAVVTGAGLVTRQLADTPVTMRATFSMDGASSKTQDFSFVVLQSDAGAQADVNAAAAALAITYTAPDTGALSVTVNLGPLPTSGIKGTQVSWATSDPGVISTSGAVTRPASGAADASVTLTATITKALFAASANKEFALIVKAQPSAKLYYLDGGSWRTMASPALTAIGVAELGSVLYALDSAGALYGKDGGWHAYASSALSGALSLTSYSGTLYAATSDGKMYCLDGTSWKLASFLAPSGTSALAGAGSSLYALAGTTVYSFDGGAWTAMGGPANPISIAVQGGILMALTSSGEIYCHEGGWGSKLSSTAVTGFAGLGGGASVLYLIAYQ